MIITDLHIYGYGKLENFQISNLQELQVFYGENEAGKSTIMSFIHSILFGFPTKQQAELRYEPKVGAKYGGQLTAYFPEKGKVIIERVKGKATGDVRIIFADGTIGNEEQLKELLLHIDKVLFQSIFSFNLQGLQNIQQMKGEDLGRFLFSAGALGTDQLLQAENTLLKELENRFKPNGKKPLLNVKLQNLKQRHNELKQAEQKNERYWLLLQESESLENEIVASQQEQLHSQIESSRLEAWKQIHPLIEETEVLNKELEQFTELSFPIDGIARLERLEELMKPLEGQIKSVETRIASIRESLQENMPNELLLNHEQQIITAVENVSLLEKLQQEEMEIESKLQEINQLTLHLLEKLHLTIQEEDLPAINTSVFMKEKVVNAEEKYRRLKNKKIDLDERFNEERQELEETEEKLKAIKQQLLPNDERAKLEEKIKVAHKKSEAQQELKQTDERIEYLSKTYNEEIGKAKLRKAKERLQYSLFSFFLISFMIWGVWKQEWPLLIIGAVCFVFLLYFILKGANSSNHEFIKEEIRTLEERRQQIIRTLKDFQFQNLVLIEQQLEKDKELSEQYARYQMHWQQKNEQYEKVLLAFEGWEKDMIEHKKEMRALGTELQLPKDLSLSHLANAFQLIEQLKSYVNEKNLVLHKKSSLTLRKDQLIQAINRLCVECLGACPVAVQEAAYMLRTNLKEEQEKQIKCIERKAKLVELQDDFQKYRLELEYYLKEQAELLQLAKAKTVEEYRELGHLAEQKLMLTERLKDVARQIQLSGFSKAEIDQFSHVTDLDHLINSKVAHLNELKVQIPALQHKLAEKKYEIQMLEEGGVYSELLHKYKQEKAELEADAKEWAKFAMAKNILDRTIESFKNERLPQMLTKAEEFLVHLTKGNYVRIYPKNEGSGFLIERKDKQVFEGNELSQATAEQVYVSIRLALAITIYKKFPFPIIIDDSFVNFDEKRTKRVIELIKNLADRQVLFFTCHKHLLAHFSKEQIVHLSAEISLPT